MSNGQRVDAIEFRITAVANTVRTRSPWQRANRDSGTALRVDDVRPGTYVVESRRLGYPSRRDTVAVVPGSEVRVTLALNDNDLRIRSHPPRFRMPGTPACVGPDDGMADLMLDRAREYAAPAEYPIEGLAGFTGDQVRLVLEPALCERAARLYGGAGSPPRRVIVIRLGSAGFMVEDPFEPHRAGEFRITMIFDAHWRLVAQLAG